MGDMIELMSLPPALQDLALSKFDALVSKGEILYQPAIRQTVTDDNFTLTFIISPSLARKPIPLRATPSPSPSPCPTPPPSDPFTSPDPAFVLARLGSSHTLILNKFCALRPMLILHTNEFHPQAEGLTTEDLRAAWMLLDDVQWQQEMMVIFNCGVLAGASQPHKHLQVVPCAGGMWAEEMELGSGEVYESEKVPFRNFVVRVEDGVTVKELERKFRALLSRTTRVLEDAGHEVQYNLVLVKGWMAIIPRTHPNQDEKAPTNGAGMMGQAWVSGKEEVNEWLELGIARHVTYMGLER